MAGKRPYRRKPTRSSKRRRTTRASVTRRRKPKQSKALDVVAKIIRLAVLIGICAFIIYRLFLPGAKKEPEATHQQVEATPTADDMGPIKPPKQEVKLDTLPKDQALDYVLKDVFDSFNLQGSWIKRNGTVLRVQLPADLPAVNVIWEIIQAIKQLNLKLLKSEEDLKANRSTIAIGTDESPLLTIIFYKNSRIKRHTGKIAIIIDDFGYYNNRTTDKFLNFKYPITLSIIPGEKYSATIAREAAKHDKTVMVHLPMEALEEKVEQGDYTIMTNMPDSVIASRVRKALRALPGAVGVNNHMGSKATANSRVMSIVLNQVKASKKIFIDSRTTNKSVVSKIAASYGLKYGLNDGFLERKKNEDQLYIKQKLAAIAKIARRRGKAIAIGHPYKETIAVLNEELPRLVKQGYQIVSIVDVIP